MAEIDDGYFDLDNFDDTIDSRDYRRRQPQRRRSSVNRRRAYNIKRRRRRRLRNRIIIVTSGIVLVALIISLITFMFKGCDSSKDDKSDISTETIENQQAASSADVPATSAPVEDTSDLSTTYFKTPKIEDDGTNGESVYGIYVWKNAGYELFGSDSQKSAAYAKTINGFADKLTGVTVYDMIVPNHTEMGLPQRLKDSDAYSTSQADNIKDVYAALSDKVTPINAYNYLADNNKDYIYFNSDHHWTALGAYYAYKAFADTNVLEALKLEDCEENTIEGFTGTFTNTVSTLEADTVHYWKLPYDVTMDVTSESGMVSYDSPYYNYAEAGTLTYGVFIMGDNPLTVLKSSSDKAQTGKKIAVVKESYGNAFVPYLTYNYEEVHVVDLRSFRDVEGDFAAYCKTNGIDEVLFLNGVMSANTQIQLDNMSALFN